MATAIDITQELPFKRPQTTGLAGGSASPLRLVAAAPECSSNGCEVVLSPSEYTEFQAMLSKPAQVIPELAALLRARRTR